jgi:hypothetical protein
MIARATSEDVAYIEIFNRKCWPDANILRVQQINHDNPNSLKNAWPHDRACQLRERGLSRGG